MAYYIILFVITAVLAWVNSGNTKVSKSVFFSFCLGIGLFVGLADMLGGYDRYIYSEVFEIMHENLKKGIFINEQFLSFFGKEPVYGLINDCIAFFTPNRYIFILVYTLFLYTIYAINFYKYTKNPFFALLVFEGLMFFFTFTYLRQVLAAGVIWLSIPYVAQRNFKKYLLFVILATLIHNSAAYMILLYFIPRRKFEKKYIVLFMLTLLLIGISGITKFVFSISGDVVSNARIAGYANTAEIGFRIEYVIESMLFLFILLTNYRRIDDDELSLTMTNVYLMFCGLLLFFCKSSDGGRISWYCLLGIIVVLERLCRPKSAIQLKAFVSIMCFILFYRILLAWGVLIYPYKTFLTPGIRQGDFIEEMYEYDHKYDNNKLYNL
ncbi:MAG: EpsG family protein [Prevotella histicola]|jgi:putative capsular polysaccharide biosynthesis protein|uniref:EpsG family protein n=1 Tax=Prevotella histicola TaxID=470565 RepID=UPI001CACEF3B|nr:EpsG family protein [Prevotella histicola]MBF1392756.1 EpsG family protein [Prevotella histicola]